MTRLDNVRDREADGFAFDVFLSHAHEDSPFARHMATWLRKCGHSVWLDEEQLIPGSRFRTGLQQGLRESRHMVAVLTASYIERSWAQRELDLFDLDADHRERRPLAIQLFNISNTPLDQIFLVSQRIPWHGESLDIEGLWKLHCGLTGQRPGPHAEWATKGERLLNTPSPVSGSGLMIRQEGHDDVLRTLPTPTSADSDVGSLQSLANEILANGNDRWRDLFATFRAKIGRIPIAVAARELITEPGPQDLPKSRRSQPLLSWPMMSRFAYAARLGRSSTCRVRQSQTIYSSATS